MTNKKEFFFIIFLCAITMAIYSVRGVNKEANALSAASDLSETKTSLDSVSSNSISEENTVLTEDDSDWNNVPSAESQDSKTDNSLNEPDTQEAADDSVKEEINSADSLDATEEAAVDNLENSAQSDVELKSEHKIKSDSNSERKDDNAGATDDVEKTDHKIKTNDNSSAQRNSEMEANEDNNKNDNIPAKEYTQYNPEKSNSNKPAVFVKLDTYKDRKKIENKKIIKKQIQEEKGTIYKANELKKETKTKTETKTEKNSSTDTLVKLETVESKIKAVKSEETIKWVKPVIKETIISDTDKNADKNIENKKNNVVPDILRVAVSEPKKISIADKSEITKLNVVAHFSDSESKIDSDKDGIPDETELEIGSDPNKKDSDGDNFDDGLELSLGYNPSGAGILAKRDLAMVKSPQLKDNENNNVAIDSDEDGISDREEFIIGSDPFNPDSDGDGYSDGEEFSKGYNPLKAADTGDDKIELENPEESEAPIAENLAVEDITRHQDKNNEGAVEGEQIILTGKAEPNSFVAVYVFSDPIASLVKADSNGMWFYILDKTLSAGEHTVYSAVVDSAGSIVAKSNPAKFLIEEIEAAPIGAEENFNNDSSSISVSIWGRAETYIAIGIGAALLGVIGIMIVKELNS